MKAQDFNKIGAELITAAKTAERTPGEIIQELFPYIYEASRRMSARDICRWLQEKYEIQISQPTISRALRNERLYWESFAEIIEPVARRVASSLDISMEELLLDDGNEAGYHLHLASEAAKEKLRESELKEVEEGLDFLGEKWFSLSVGTRRACAPSITSLNGDDSEEARL